MDRYFQPWRSRLELDAILKQINTEVLELSESFNLDKIFVSEPFFLSSVVQFTKRKSISNQQS